MNEKEKQDLTDEITKNVFDCFYRHLKGSGLSAKEAIKQAETHTLNVLGGQSLSHVLNPPQST